MRSIDADQQAFGVRRQERSYMNRLLQVLNSDRQNQAESEENEEIPEESEVNEPRLFLKEAKQETNF